MSDSPKALGGMKAALHKVWKYVKSYVLPFVGVIIGAGAATALDFGKIVDTQLQAQTFTKDSAGACWWKNGFGGWLVVGVEAPIAIGMVTASNWLVKTIGGFVGGLAVAGTKKNMDALSGTQVGG